MKAETYQLRLRMCLTVKVAQNVITSTAETGIKTSLLKLEMDSS